MTTAKTAAKTAATTPSKGTAKTAAANAPATAPKAKSAAEQSAEERAPAKVKERAAGEAAGFLTVADGSSVRQGGRRYTAGAFIRLVDAGDVKRLREKGVVRLPTSEEIKAFKADFSSLADFEAAAEKADPDAVRIAAEAEQAVLASAMAGQVPDQVPDADAGDSTDSTAGTAAALNTALGGAPAADGAAA